MIRFFTRWCVLGVTVCVAFASTASAQLAVRQDLPAAQPALSGQGVLHGVVRDDHGRPIGGAVVSAVGATSAFAISDAGGRFNFRTLPFGAYLVRAHLQGYLPERGRVIQVTSAERGIWTIALTRLDADKDPPVLAAGVGTTGTAPPPEADDDHGEVAWRMRHARRSVLKDAGQQAIVEDDDSFISDSLSGIGRAVGTPARLAAALFTDVTFNGQIDLLTSTTFNRPQDLFTTSAGLPHSVAYVTLAAPTNNGDWTIRGSITQGDLASWILAGSYRRTTSAAHQYEAGLSYSMQRYQGGNADALAAMRDGSRNVGAVYAYDNWRIAPRMTVSYGAKYANYDYLEDPRLLSPKASVTVQPLSRDSLRLRTTVSHRETAPGAEEFLPPTIGPWLPPERTFSSVSRTSFSPERLDHVEFAVERKFAADVVIGMRAFRQQIEDQMVTLFDAPSSSSVIGHYLVGSAGDFDADGWGVSVSRAVGDTVRASVDYTQVGIERIARSADRFAIRRLARSALRENERVRDLTTSVETLVAATATRVFVVYKVNDGFAAAQDSTAPLSRFNVQVNQPLPFLNFTSARWEMLVAVRTLFREDLLDASVYDELLVVKPPKRVLGGVTVRF